MKKKTDRRNFLKESSMLCLGGCLLMSSKWSFAGVLMDGETPDPKKLNYCGYTCPEKCEYKLATKNNDPKAKKECYEAWKIEERYGLKYDESTSFCYGCKTSDKPLGVVTTNCTVRSCAIEKEFDCCIECIELTSCDKDLWTRFPEFYNQIKDLQKEYLASLK